MISGRAAQDLADPPALLTREGTGLLDQHAVADPARVGLVVRLQLLRRPDDALVARMAVHALDPHHPRLLHRVAHHDPFAGLTLGHALHLVDDPSGLHDRHPFLRVPLALAHPGLGRLLRDGLVGEDPDPDLAAALEAPGECDPRRLDLPARDPAWLERLQPVLAERERRAPLRGPPHTPALGLSVLDALGHQHARGPLRLPPARRATLRP